MLAQNEKSVTILFFITAIFADILIFATHQSINSFDAFIDIHFNTSSMNLSPFIMPHWVEKIL